MDCAAVSSSAFPLAVRIPVVILVWKLLAVYLWENSALSMLPHYLSPLSDCLNVANIVNLFLNWFFVKVIKKFSFFFFPEKSKETKSLRNSEGAYLCCQKHALIPFWTDYLQSTWFPCLLAASHLYYRCQIQWHWCSGSELYSQRGSFRVSGTKAYVTYAVPAARHCFSLVHTKKALLYALCASTCSLSLVLLLLCCNCARACRTVQSTCLATTKKYRNRKKSSKAEEGGKCLYLLCCICLRNIAFYLNLIQSSNKSS